MTPENKPILCVRLCNWPIDRFRRQLVREARRDEISGQRTEVRGQKSEVGVQRSDFTHAGVKRSGTPRSGTPDASARQSNVPTFREDLPQRVRRWNHQVWAEGPRKLTKVNEINPVAQKPSVADPSTATSNPQPATRSLALVRPIAQRELIIAVNEAARAKSIRPGMTLSEARALDAMIAHAVHEPDRDAVALDALARWMLRFSPVVSTLQMSDSASAEMSMPGAPGSLRASFAGSYYNRFTGFVTVNSETANKACRHTKSAGGSRGGTSAAPSVSTDHGLLIDLTGCERVFHGLDRIVRLVDDALKRFHIAARLAVAPNPAAAWALTFSPKHRGTIVSETDLPAALESLPPATLRLDPDLVQSLHHLGLATIGQIVKLPRESLPARFGDRLLRRIDQAFGRINEPLVPIEPFSPLAAKMDFDGPVDSLEAIWGVFKNLIGETIAELLKRGRGARTIDVEFLRPYTSSLHQTIRLSRASRDPVNIFNLVRCAMEKMEQEEGKSRQGKKKKQRTIRDDTSLVYERMVEEGYSGIRIVVTHSERVSDEQIALLEHEEYAGEIELGHLIERLAVRLGEKGVAQPQFVESHVPEHAFAWHGFSTRALEKRVEARVENPCHRSRPLHLFPPEEIHVMVTPSHDRDGKPISFTRSGRVHRIAHAIGPERIAGPWWEGNDKTRDYFDVEDEKTGERFWVFRVLETRRWYVQGEYE